MPDLSPTFSLPPALLEEITQGNAAIFLGAGANRSATSIDGRKVPLGAELRDMLSDRFLGGECRDRSLDEVASFVENEAGLAQLESFIAQTLRGFSPSPGHLTLPKLRWQALYTLNYDILIEDAYNSLTACKQRLLTFSRDQQNIDREMRAETDPLPLFKLHGSVDRIYDPSIRLVLSQEGYLRWDEHRQRLYSRLRDSVAEYPVIFAGTALGDAHIKILLNEAPSSRPMQYIVSPSLTSYDAALFSSKRITPIKATFDQFIEAVDRAISPAARVLGSVLELDAPVQRHFRVNRPTPASLIAFLNDNVDYVSREMTARPLTADEFFKGESQSWSPIQKSIDIERTVYESIMLRCIGLQGSASQRGDIVVIKGPSGSGKTVLVRRIAYDLAVKYDHMVLFAPPRANLRLEPLELLWEASGKRAILIIDQAADQISFVRQLVERARSISMPITIVIADTQAAFGGSLQDVVSDIRSTYEVRRLSESKIDALLTALERNNCLGVLAYQTLEERKQSFSAVADRQLLVALYEATQGRPLEDLLLDEYNRIASDEAQEFYLLICTLHQYRVTVRAGLVRRVLGVSFEDFTQRLLGPLEEIVATVRDPASRDMSYRARHTQVSEIVFRRVLDTGSKRVSQFLRILDQMDISYSSDGDALRQLVNYRNLRDVAPAMSDARRIIDEAEVISAAEPFVLQQRALLEMNSVEGDLRTAREYLDRAQAARPGDRSFAHSRATLLAREARANSDPLTQKALRGEAKAILHRLTRDKTDPYIASLTAQIAIDELSDLTDQELDDRIPQVLRLIEDAETAIRDGLRGNPDFQQLTMQDMRLKRIIGSNDRAIMVLQRALDRQPHMEHVAAAYSRAVKGNMPDDAVARLRSALVDKPMSRILNAALFEVLLSKQDNCRGELWPILRKSFTDEDGNLEAHVHAIRFAFVNNDMALLEERRAVASRLNVSASAKERPRLPFRNMDEGDGLFQGAIADLGSTFGFIHDPRFGASVYIREDVSASPEVWDRIYKGRRVRYRLEFNSKGAIGTAIEVDI